VTRRGYLKAALSHQGLRRLLAMRLTGQFGDGVFQASLAGTVLFNPERQAHASDIASGFAVVLVPFSILGPFAGVLLDRWWRQRVLGLANVARAFVVAVLSVEVALGWTGAGFYVTALVAISLSRFILAALSASLPHVVTRAELVTTNALTTTLGTIASTAGGASAIGARALIGNENGQYALIALAAAVLYLVAASLARRFPRDALGPDEVQRRNRETVGEVLRGLQAGARHVRTTPDVRLGLSVIAVHRLGYGLTVVSTVLLYRNYFHGHGVFRAGLAGLSQVVAMLAVGGGVAALATPGAFRRIGLRRWVTGLLILAAVAMAACGLPFRLPLVLLGAFALGFTAQGIKISVDTTVQQQLEDRYRGRVFSLYDAILNMTLVLAAVLTALALPENGRSPATVIAIAAGYAVTAAVFGLNRPSGRAVDLPARS
jgi:MFS family permease